MGNTFNNIKSCLVIFSFNSLIVISTIIILTSCSGQKNIERKSSLMIGIAEINYTTEVGLDLLGNYRGNDYASRGIHDSLYARAIVAANSKGEKAAILSIDICSLTKEPVEMIRSYISQVTEKAY